LTLEVLKYLAKKRAKSKVLSKRVDLFSVQHLLPDSIDFFRSFKECSFDKMTIIGIAYSSKRKVAQRLRSLGATVVIPEFKDIYESVKDLLYNDLRECEDKGKWLVILEDGGYAAPILHDDPLKKHINQCLGVVEQTKNGLWLDRRINDLQVPIVHVAESILKDSVEGPAVGEAIVRTLEDFLGSVGVSLSGKEVLVLGYGTIGMNVSKKLKSRNAIVMCYDTKTERNIAARLDGFVTDTKTNVVGKADVVIGCTGSRSIGRDEFFALKHGAYLASASSKNIEIDLEELALVAGKTKRIGKEIVKFELINNKDVFLFSNGFPINFRGKFSVPKDVMDLILSELFTCTLDLIEKRSEPGIYPISYENESKIASLWEKIY